MKLKQFLVLGLAASLALAATGCNFLRKNKKPKENKAIASQVEADFRQRWLSHRVTELTAKGTPAGAAQEQAEAEFRQQYPYVQDAKK